MPKRKAPADTSSARDRLRAEIRELTAKEDFAGLKAALERLDLLNRGEAATPPDANRRFQWIGLVFFTSAAIVAVAWLLRLPRATVDIEASARQLEVRPATEFDFATPWKTKPDRHRMSGLHALRIDGQPAISGTSMTIVFTGGPGVSLDRLTASEARIVRFSAHSGGCIEVLWEDGFVNGSWTFEAQANVQVVDPEFGERTLELIPDSTLAFSKKQPGTLELHACPAEARILDDVQVERLSLSEHAWSRTGEEVWRPSLVKGSLAIKETATTMELGPRDVVSLESEGSGPINLTLGEFLQVDYRGRVKRIGTRRADLVTDLRPSWLDYASSKRIGALFGAGSALWGAAWSLRKLLGGS